MLPVSLFAGGAWWSWQQVEADARLRLARVVDVQREHVLRVFEAQETMLAAIQARIRGLSWEDISKSGELHDFLRQVEASAPGTSGAGIIAPDGKLAQLSGAFPAPPLDLAGRDYFQAHRDGRITSSAFVGATMFSGLTRRPLFALSRPSLDAQGQPDGGVVWATIRPADLQAFYAAVAEGPSDTVLLLRTDGVVLARHPPLDPLVGRQLPRASPQFAAVTQAVSSDGAVITKAASAFDGVQRLYALRHVPGYPVVVAYGQHASAPRAVWLRQLAVIGAVSSVLCIVLLALTWLVRRQAKREAAALSGERNAMERAKWEAERRADAEAALREGQRLEILGQLAAGVAHDFRNMVQAVQGGARLIQHAAAQNPERVQALAEMVAKAAGRGAELTNRMLDFARGRSIDGAEVTDPRTAVEAAVEILRVTLGAGYQIRGHAAERLPELVVSGRAELEAAVMNLVINARDAMPRGGEIAVLLDPHQDPASLQPGPYARVTVVDTGEGMDEATLARATQAFFTTKPRGKGTGLGLATVRAFAEGAGGALQVESTLGKGTTVTFWLPDAATVRQ
jgi:two-component system NtrC family sensor kinase